MADRHLQSDLSDESQFGELLREGYGGNPPTSEFEATLLGNLATQFRQQYFAATDLATDLATTPLASQGATHLECTRPTERRSWIGLRLALTMATAASLLFVCAVWNSQAAYGWASMLSALEKCEWVHATSDSSALYAWVSSGRQVLAIRSDSQTLYSDGLRMTTSRYLADRDVIHQQKPLKRNAVRSSGEQLFLQLLGASGDDPASLGSGYSVVAESWRTLPAEAGEDNRVELIVRLRETQGRRQTHKLLLIIDAETQLPESCRLLADNRSEAGQAPFETVEFAYPADGPDSIFDVGVPRDTLVVASLANVEGHSAADARVAEAAGALVRGEQDEDVDRLASRDGTARIATEDSREVTNRDEQESAAETLLVEVEQIVTRSSKAEVHAPDAEAESSNLPAQPPTHEELAASEKTTQQREVRKIALLDVPLPSNELVEKINLQLATCWDEQGVAAGRCGDRCRVSEACLSRSYRSHSVALRSL